MEGSAIASRLTTKVGPLPVYGWAGLGAIGLVVLPKLFGGFGSGSGTANSPTVVDKPVPPKQQNGPTVLGEGITRLIYIGTPRTSGPATSSDGGSAVATHDQYTIKDVTDTPAHRISSDIITPLPSDQGGYYSGQIPAGAAIEYIEINGVRTPISLSNSGAAQVGV